MGWSNLPPLSMIEKLRVHQMNIKRHKERGQPTTNVVFVDNKVNKGVCGLDNVENRASHNLDSPCEVDEDPTILVGDNGIDGSTEIERNKKGKGN